MNNTASWLAAGGLIGALTIGLLWRSRGRDILPYLIVFFASFGFGPVVNHLLGHEVYFGTVTDRIGQASVGMALALFAAVAVGTAIPVPAAAMDRSRLGRPDTGTGALPAMLLVLAGYAVAALVLLGPRLLVGDKLARLAVAGPLHYHYLTLQILAASTFFLARTSRAGRLAYGANMACYVGYCLATHERDFLFVLIALLLHLQLFRPRTMVKRIGFLGAGLVAIGSGLAMLRGSGTGQGLTRALNEGSVLFVDTYVMHYVPREMPLQAGASYLHALLNLLPPALRPESASEVRTLSLWLVDKYAPGSSGGYGFTMTAEAYLNFGMVGIPVVFGVLTVIQRLLVTNAGHGHYRAYASVLFTIAWLYGFRGESATMIKTFAYGNILYFLLWLSRPAVWRRKWSDPGTPLYGPGSVDGRDSAVSRPGVRPAESGLGATALP